jgi:hypothetical protein
MPGGLLNLVSYGNQNIILNGNPSKTFFKCVYSKYTNFGLQKFRIDYEGLRNIRETETSRFKFKIPRYGDLLMDTYLVINLPNIWSPILPPTTDNSSIKQTITDIWKPYEFKWIKDLGTQLIERVRFTVGNSTIQEFTGQYLKCMVERDFDNTKKDLYDRMTGNIPELNDPANAFKRNGNYPNVYPTNIPNYNSLGPEPSIRARKLYIPLNIWFTLASKMAFPLVSLQYQEFHIEVDIRPLNELFTIRDMETVVNPTTNSPFLPPPNNGWDNLPTSSISIGPHIKPDFSNQLYQFYNFLQPPPWQGTTPDLTLTTSDWSDKNTSWSTDIHLESTYVFLTDEEVKTFAANEQKYLIKQAYHYIHDNIVDSAKPSLISSLGMVSNWMWYFQRNDVNLRNQWSNYTNWEYDYQPYSVVDPSGCFDLNGTPTLGTPNAPLVTVISSGGSTQQVNPANNPGGFNTGYKITGNYQLANQKTIMRTWGLLLNGKYRETTQDAGVLDYIEKYTRTSGNAPDGLYCYNFCLHTNPFDFQPSGAINISKFNQIEFELTTYPPPLNPNSQRIDICDASGNSIGVDKPVWNIYNYTYNLNILEERYNILSFIGGNASLMYAR